MNKKILFLICLSLLSSCAQLPTSDDKAKDLALQKLKPALGKILSHENPISSPERSTYPLVQQLPGKPFVPRQTIRSLFTYNSKGHLVFSQGDYVIPVMTYCMSSSASSPEGHVYSLSKLEGKRAKIIQQLNLLAPAKYFTDEIQMVSWGIQNGLSYEELGSLGQEMVDSVIPRYKSELQESLLAKLERRWNRVSSLLAGVLPSFNSSAESLEENLGELGKRIRKMREYRDRLREVGYDYGKLSELIDTTSHSQLKGDTLWSKLSNNIYARFVTEGSFGEIGYLQVRVVSSESGRVINSIHKKQEILDITYLLANPNSLDIQPLSFSPLYGVGGTIILTPALSRHPLAGALLFSAVLGAKYIDWESFFDAQDLLQNSEDRDVQREIKRGMQALSKEHDKLEKPLKEAGIISGKTKNTSSNKEGKVREYTKDGGDEALQKDFEKINGVPSMAKDGTETKTLVDGTTVVKRPKTDDDPTTLEVQPPKEDSQYPDHRIRVKVRY